MMEVVVVAMAVVRLSIRGGSVRWLMSSCVVSVCQ